MEIIERRAVRAIMLTPEREILLMYINPPDGGRRFWVAPGGGLLPGEDPEAGLRCELWEELGLDRFDLGPLLWRRQHTFTWGKRRIRQRGTYYAVHVDRFTPQMLDRVEAQYLECFRWWPVDELAQARDPLTPLSLADIVERYLRHGPPTAIPPVEVLVD